MRDKHEINCMNSLYTCIIYICVCVCARISIYIYTYIDNLSVHINATQKSIFKINICSLSSTMVAKLVPVDVPAVLLPQSLPGSIGFDHLDLWPLRSSSSSSPKCRARRPLKKKVPLCFTIIWDTMKLYKQKHHKTDLGHMSLRFTAFLPDAFLSTTCLSGAGLSGGWICTQ